MNAVLHSDAQRLERDVEKVKEGVECLTKDCSAWARRLEEADLVGLMEDLKGVEVDVSLMMTDCISAGGHHREGAPKVIFHDFREIFGCLDTLFHDLKEARLQLNKTYIHPAILDHLKMDYGRFRKHIGEIQRYLK